MRALTLTQPWAGLVAAGIKLVENRTHHLIKRDSVGVRFAIHASREIDEAVYDRIEQIAPEIFDEYGDFYGAPWWILTRHTSAVIAVATLADIVFDKSGMLAHEIAKQLGEQRRWYTGQIGYVLRDVQALATPIECRGMLGFWTLPEDVERRVMEQLG